MYLSVTSEKSQCTTLCLARIPVLPGWFGGGIGFLLFRTNVFRPAAAIIVINNSVVTPSRSRA